VVLFHSIYNGDVQVQVILVLQVEQLLRCGAAALLHPSQGEPAALQATSSLLNLCFLICKMGLITSTYRLVKNE
jgi:hypothetical protein